MDLNTCGSVARWTARTLGTLYFAFIAWFIIAHAISPEGLPPIGRFSLAQHLDTLALFLMVVGSVVGWKWECAAAAMVLVGTAIWVSVERNLPWPPGVTLAIGILYAIAWWDAKWPCRERLIEPEVSER